MLPIANRATSRRLLGRRGCGVAIAVAFSMLFGCGDTFKPGTPSGLGQAASTGGGGGGGGGGGTFRLVAFQNVITPLTGTNPLSMTAAQGGSSAEEIWLIAEDSSGALQNSASLTVSAFDPGTTTPAASQPTVPVPAFLIGGGNAILFIITPVPTTAVDYVVDDGQGNSATVAAKPPGGTTSQQIVLASPPDQSTGTASDETLSWTDSGSHSSYLVYVFGTPQMFPNHLPFTGELPVMVELTGSSFKIGSGAGAQTIFADAVLPSPKPSGSKTWGWMVVGLDQDGWGADPAQYYFDMETQ